MILKRLIQIGLIGLVFNLAVVTRAQSNPSMTLGSGQVTGLNASPDGHWLVVMTTTGAYLQDATRLDVPPMHLDGHYDMVWYARFSHDSRLLATASPDLTVIVYDTATGQQVDSIGLSAAASEMIFSPDDSLLFISSGTQKARTAFLYDVVHHHGEALKGFAPYVTFTGDGALVLDRRPDQNQVVIQHYHPGAEGFSHDDQMITSPILKNLSYSLDNTISPDGKVISIADMNQQTVDFIDITSERDIAHVRQTTESGAFSEDGVYAAIPTRAGITVITLATGKISILPAMPNSAFGVSDHWLAYVNPSGEVMLHNLASWQEVMLQTSDTSIRNLVVSEGYAFVSGSKGLKQFAMSSGVRILSLESGGYPDQITVNGDFVAYSAWNHLTALNLKTGEQVTLDNAIPEVYDAVGFTDANHFFYVSNDNQATRVSLSDQARETVLLPSLGNNILDVAYSPDGQRLAFSADHHFSVVNTATGTIEGTFDLGEQQINKLAYTPDGKFLIFNTADYQLGVWDMQAGKRLDDLNFGIEVDAFAISPDGQFLAVGNSDGVSLATLQEALAGNTLLTPLKGDVPQTIRALVFSPDGRWLAAGYGFDYTATEHPFVYLWDINNHRAAQALEDGHLDGAVNLAFSPDSKRIAAVGGSLDVWTISKPSEPLYVIPRSTLASAAFSPDGNWLLSTDFFGNYTRKTYIFRAEDGLLRGTSQYAATGNVGGGSDGVPGIPLAVSPDGTQFAAVDNGGVLSLRTLEGAALESGAAEILAYCDSLPEKPVSPRPDQAIAVMWSWYAKTLQQVFDHINTASYEISIDGQPQYTGSVMPDAIQRDPVNNNNWTVYYRLYSGPFAAGEHTIQYRVTWNRQISDGFDTFGPDSGNTEQTGSCAFTVK